MKCTLGFPLRLAALTAALALAPVSAFAGGPLALCRPGTPYLWPNGGANIPWNPDQGSLGPLTNQEAIDLVAQGFEAWDALPSAATTYLQGAPLSEDVNLGNFMAYVFSTTDDGVSPIVFDDTGEIIDLLYGQDSGILGFAGPDRFDGTTCTITEGLAVLNGAEINQLQEALDVMVHEFGHYQNLAHAAVNGQVHIGDTTGPTPFNTFPPEALAGVLDNAIETMYPFYFGAGFGAASPNPDDISALSTLYPAADFAASTGTITGRILSFNGRSPRTGFNVIARNVDNPFLDAVSAISSQLAFDDGPGAPFAGVYTLRGLTPNAQYAIFVDVLFTPGRYGFPPAALPGTEEFYSGSSEGHDLNSDPPDQYTPVSVAAGGTASGVDIIFNRFRPDETLPLAVDSSIELSLPFPFWMCGRRYDEVIVNSNGLLSFGALNNGFLESAAGFRAGPPQIAGVWDDFNPTAGGAVFFTQSRTRFTVTFESVPEYAGPFTGTGSNTFSIALERFPSRIEINYGSLTLEDGLAGVSCGGAVTSGFETPIDLSQRAGDERISLLFRPAVFEEFFAATDTAPGSLNDLSNLTLRFTTTTPYSDLWSEPNQTLGTATPISLPFDSIPVSRFTEIGDAGDVDFFRFTAAAGQRIIARILTSQLDTVLGVFSRDSGQLLGVDDDSGPGLLSTIVIEIPDDGEYAVAVTTFPDFEFDGAARGAARYVLEVFAEQPTTTGATRTTDP